VQFRWTISGLSNSIIIIQIIYLCIIMVNFNCHRVNLSIVLSRYFAWKVQKFQEVSQEVKKALMVIHASQGKIVRALLDTIVLYKIGVLWLGRWKQYIRNHEENFIERYEAILNGNRLVE